MKFDKELLIKEVAALVAKVALMAGSEPVVAKSTVLEDNPENKYKFMLAFVKKINKPISELHEKATDVYICIEGEAEIITGGKLVNAKEQSPGELLGDDITDGTLTKLISGMILTIPSSTPHMIRSSKDFVYLITKVFQ